jgi:ornithine cyclodeaminase
MQASLLRELRRRQLSIRARWDALLHAEPVTPPLRLPHALVHPIAGTMAALVGDRSVSTAAGRRTVFKAVGSALADLAAAALVWRSVGCD